jgi:hypothetical protein
MKRLDLGPARKRRVTELGIYGALFLTLLIIVLWLGFDLIDGRNRIIAERTGLAIQKSQFMSQWFGTTLLAADVVLRGINDKIEVGELAGATPERFARLSTWLTEKMGSIPGMAGISIYDANCVFVAAADPRLVGFHSNQWDCAAKSPKVENQVHVQYMPADKSASKRPVILVTRHKFSPDGHFLGGSLAAIDLDFAQKWVGTFPLGVGDVLAVVDGDGTLLAHNPPLPEFIGKRTQKPDSQPIFGEDRSSAGFVDVSTLDGHQLIFGTSKIEHIPIVMIVGYDMATTLA